MTGSRSAIPKTIASGTASSVFAIAMRYSATGLLRLGRLPLAFNHSPERSMHSRTTSDPQRRSCQDRGVVTALERRISEVEQLAASQGRELRIQFERMAHL
jgi:hypothetical protein